MNAPRPTGRAAQRAALSNGVLVRYAISVLFIVIAEWAVALGVLVYVFDKFGAAATGYSAIALLAPYVLFSPISGALAERYPAQRVRVGAMILQTAGFAVAALAAFAGEQAALVVIPTMIGIGGSTILGPAGAVLRPAIVRSSQELTIANLWSGYADSMSVLGGPLLATVMLALGGAPAVVAASAVVSAAALLISVYRHPPSPPGGQEASAHVGAIRLMRRELRTVRSRPGVMSVLIVAGAQYFLVGAMEIIVVVAAEDEFGLGPSGAGTLATAIGVGAFVSSGVTTLLVRRKRLAPLIGIAMLAIAACTFVLGIAMTALVAFMVLPIMGLARSSQDLLGVVLLQRSAEPEALGSVFAVLELAAGLALIAGTLVAQILIAIGGVQAALFGCGVYFVLLFALTINALRSADDSADVPVVVMSLLRRVPLFEPLPRPALEAVARATEEIEVDAGDRVIAQGEPGDRFYVVTDGEFEVQIDGEVVDSCHRGDSFGELALLADTPRAATVSAVGAASLVAIDRGPFLIAVTGHDSSRQAAWGVMQRMQGDGVPIRGPHEFARPPVDAADTS